MPNKGQSDTSRFAYEKIMAVGARDNMYKKIILALEWIMDGTNYEIAAQIRCKPEKVWKRTGISELSNPIDGALFDTGLRRNSPDGNPCIVYALSSRRSEYPNIPKEKHYMEGETTAADYASKLTATAENHKKEIEKRVFKQPTLFEEEK
jgi:hypothetical protein